MKKRIRITVSLLLAAAILMALCSCGSASAGDSAGGADTASPALSTAAVDTVMTVGTTQAFTDDPVSPEDVRTILEAGLAAESAINQQPWFFAAVTDREVMEDLSASGGRPGKGSMPSPPEGAPGSGAPDGAPDGAPGFTPPEGAPESAPPEGAPGSAPTEGAPGSAPPSGTSGFKGGSGARASLGDSPLAIIVYMDGNTSSPNPDFDCGLAVQNMVITAASLGYGVKIVSSPTMTLNGTEHDQICEKLGVDPSLTAIAVLLVGVPDESTDAVSGSSARDNLETKTVIIE